MKKTQTIGLSLLLVTVLYCRSEEPIGTCNTLEPVTTNGANSPTQLAKPVTGAPVSVKGTAYPCGSNYCYTSPSSYTTRYQVKLSKDSGFGHNFTMHVMPDPNGATNLTGNAVTFHATSQNMQICVGDDVYPSDRDMDIYQTDVVEYTITIAELPPVTTLASTPSDGIAELTALPTLDIAAITGSTGGTVNVTVPVDNDTGFISAVFINRADPFNGSGAVTATLTPGSAQNGNVTFNIPASTFIAGDYIYLKISLATSQVEMQTNGTFTSYEINGTTTADIVYSKKSTVTNNAGLPDKTDTLAPSLTIN